MARPLIALVDDDAAILDLLTEILADEGYQTISCRTGSEALEAIQKELPALVLLDMRLEYPESGWIVLEKLRHDPTTMDIPVMLCTADTRYLRECEQQLRAQGCDILEKPFDLDIVLEKVNMIVGDLPLMEREA
jgi:CheY-like chemotaxis protein